MKLFILTITFLLVQLSDQVNQNQSFYQASQFLMFSLQAAMNKGGVQPQRALPLVSLHLRSVRGILRLSLQMDGRGRLCLVVSSFSNNLLS